MATKRAHDLGQEDFPPEPAKRQRRDRNGDGRGGGPNPNDTDATYGQRYVFPSLDEPTAPSSDEDFAVEDEQDALAYLRSVRQEASGIPHLLVASKAGPHLPPPTRAAKNDLNCDDDDAAEPEYDVDRSIYTDGVGDSRGYYYDGTYTAMPDEADLQDDVTAQQNPDLPDEETRREEQARQAFYSSIITRFVALRESLHQDPPVEALLALPRTHGYEVGAFTTGRRGAGARAFKVWRWRLMHTDPMPAQVAAMDRSAAFRLLRVILSGSLLRRGFEVTERTSSWLWALLARLPDAGELDYADVGAIRELGKRAVLMLASIAHMAALREQVDQLDDGSDGDNGPEIEPEDFSFAGDDDAEEVATTSHANGTAHGNPPEEAPPAAAPASVSEDGEVAEADEDQPMDLEDGEVEEGEVPDDDPPAQPQKEDIEAIKARLLAQLEPSVNLEPEIEGPSAEEQEQEAKALRARMNMRATLNMILTVAGEFYGQRDLLEFRDPFKGL